MSVVGALHQSNGTHAHVLPGTLPVSEMEMPSQTGAGSNTVSS